MSEASPIVKLSLGKVQGTAQGKHLEFLGIRYAKAPVGDLRYLEPEPVEHWEGVYDATKYANIAPQIWDDDPPIELTQAEDCLFLNVYTPGIDQRKRPVMFYIHGGAFAIGSGSRGRLYGGHLAERGDVVVVTIQYRLGPLGFLFMEGIPSNLGLKDQLCALRWIKNNIEQFGGDPNNITIFGQSAGSISVSYLLTMPAAEGLFHKAIAQSATLPKNPPTPAKATDLTREFLSILGISYGNVEALRRIDWHDIVLAQQKIGKDILSDKHHTVVPDDVSVPKDSIQQLKTGFARNIPLIIGHTADEFPIFGGFLKSKNVIFKAIAKRYISKHIENLGLEKRDLKSLLREYKQFVRGSKIKNKEYDLLIMDMGFRIPSLHVADTHSGASGGTYYYEFAYPAPHIGAAVHVLDLFFVFHTLETKDISKAMKLLNSPEERSLSYNMMDAWVAFAHKGNPNHPELPEWKEYDPNERAIMEFNIESKQILNYMEARVKLWKDYSLL